MEEALRQEPLKTLWALPCEVAWSPVSLQIGRQICVLHRTLWVHISHRLVKEAIRWTVGNSLPVSFPQAAIGCVVALLVQIADIDQPEVA
jgi:hypothetical protein